LAIRIAYFGIRNNEAKKRRLDRIDGHTSDADRQAEYELFVLRRTGDLLPFYRERVRMILEEGPR